MTAELTPLSTKLLILSKFVNRATPPLFTMRFEPKVGLPAQFPKVALLAVKVPPVTFAVPEKIVKSPAKITRPPLSIFIVSCLKSNCPADEKVPLFRIVHNWL
jgi:hypothetical protein